MGVSAEQYQQSLDYLFGRLNYERMGSSKYSTKDFKLDRMQELLRFLSNPQSGVPTIHVAGTKGKGSTSVMIADMLSAAGYQTGLFTSPHVTKYEERILIDGHQIEPEQLIGFVNEITTQVKFDQDTSGPTFFELTTALAWMHFNQQRVDFAVMEVGLGGRLDSTNVCEPLVCVITNISYDHMALLGNTIAKITREKAGIIKPGVPVFSGVTQPEAIEVLEEVCAEKQAPLFLLNRDYFWEPSFETEDQLPVPGFKKTQEQIPTQKIQVKTPWSAIDEMPVNLLGTHQAANAALAVTILDYLRHQETPIELQRMRAGMASVKWPARIEVVQKSPPVIVDTAHNDASINALIKTLEESFGHQNRLLIFAASRDKDIKEMLTTLLPHFQTVILTQYLSNPRRVLVDELLELMQSIQCETKNTSEVIVTTSPDDAWLRAKACSTSDTLTCVTGSFFIAAEMRELLLGTADEILISESC
ncbi:bifunctional folylpolyglutamate synthase/dihydrofolate synthase [Gimesia aquarii]|uniref:Dihydrofolate synthase/folylpolyglutamate synthase n=1 Tax=Gimesia aquarii TaxID=2527964 RepID=A0A517VXB3_9PLAN|nr:folylpolyglutamate synthase/dihydrofolate synthase family protein [Gimesia aquarii]QDT97639.1 Folylpolyglutamate synthase [Gimesia aquarii]